MGRKEEGGSAVVEVMEGRDRPFSVDSSSLVLLSVFSSSVSEESWTSSGVRSAIGFLYPTIRHSSSSSSSCCPVS